MYVDLLISIVFHFWQTVKTRDAKKEYYQYWFHGPNERQQV
jgi:outer membrane lipoprotein-sorting protein